MYFYRMQTISRWKQYMVHDYINKKFVDINYYYFYLLVVQVTIAYFNY